MTHFLIKYRFTNGSVEEWHREIARFIAEIDSDPALSGKITYRSMKNRNGPDYYHFATAIDDQAARTLQAREFFKHYTESVKLIAGGELEVLPLEIIAETTSSM
jgi:hypothetical protein